MKTNNKFYISQVSTIVPAGKAVIFWDTCALLDVIRVPLRANLITLHNYEKIADLIDSGEVVSITSEMVLSEFNDHYLNERKIMEDEQNNRKNKVVEYSDYMASTKKKDKIKAVVSTLNVITRLELLVNRILRQTYIIRGESTYRDFADFRLRNKIAPAARKAEYKDCYIWGAFLKFAHEYPHTKLVFVTSNPKDYKQGNAVHPNISQDCVRANAQCLFNIGAAYGYLK